MLCVDLDSEEFACNAEDLGLIPGWGRSPGGRNGNTPPPVLLPGESHGQRSLGGPQSMRSQSRTGLSNQQLCCAKSLQSCPTVCAFVDGSPPGSCVHRILQARILKGVAFPFSRVSSQPGIKPTPLTSLALAGRFFTTNTTNEAILFFTQGHNSRNH